MIFRVYLYHWEFHLNYNQSSTTIDFATIPKYEEHVEVNIKNMHDLRSWIGLDRSTMFIVCSNVDFSTRPVPEIITRVTRFFQPRNTITLGSPWVADIPEQGALSRSYYGAREDGSGVVRYHWSDCILIIVCCNVLFHLLPF